MFNLGTGCHVISYLLRDLLVQKGLNYIEWIELKRPGIGYREQHD